MYFIAYLAFNDIRQLLILVCFSPDSMQAKPMYLSVRNSFQINLSEDSEKVKCALQLRGYTMMLLLLIMYYMPNTEQKPV